MIEHYSNRIQNVIQAELFNAKRSIKIAVAWFTNDLLFQPLLLKLELGVSVSLLLNKDDINNPDNNSLDFERFIENGGSLYWNDSSRLLHDKFCIIDDSVVIAGSYNWTNKAEYNDESITLFREERGTSDFYIDKFNALIQKHEKESGTSGCVRKDSPMSIRPYTKLRFYDAIIIRDSFVFGLSGKDRRYALLDNATFLPITPFIFSEISTLKAAGRIWLKGDTKWGLFDCNKRSYFVQPDYDKVSSCNVCKGFYIVEKNDRYGLIDSAGKIVIACIYDCIFEKFGSSRCVFLKNNGLLGLFESVKNRTLPCSYDQIQELENDYFALCRNGKYGLCYEGHVVTDLEYDSIKCNFCGGWEIPIVEKNGKFGVHNGVCLIIPCQYDSIEQCHHDLFVCGVNNKYGVLDKKGKTVIECRYDNIQYAEPFGHSELVLKHNGEGWTYHIREHQLLKDSDPRSKWIVY